MTDNIFSDDPDVYIVPEGLELKYRRQAFVYEYLINLSISEACNEVEIHAATGTAWMKDPAVQEAIARGMMIKARRKGIDANWVLDKLVAIVETSLDDFLVIPEFGAPYYDLSQATPDQRAMLESLQIDSTVSQYDKHNIQQVIKTKLTLPSKIKALEMIGKHVDVQAFRERMDVTMHSVEERLIAGRKRTQKAIPQLTVIPGAKESA